MNELEIRERFFASRDALSMLRERTERVDWLVRQRWSGAPGDSWSQNPGLPPHVALVATGGYGRGELFPFSDIDLLILTPDEKSQDEIREPLGVFLRDLWDEGLRVSQSVHRPQDCNRIDEENAELAVSLLDRRFLAGDQWLFDQIRDPRAELGRDIARLTRERHRQYQDTIFHLEPNVKEAPGGMRDLQVLRWLSKLGLGGGDFPAGMVSDGIPVLFEIRCYLHYLAGRDENRLTFERQDEIATNTGASSPEELMRRYYRAVKGISKLAMRNIERCEAKRSSLFAALRDRSSSLSNHDISVVQGKAQFRSPQALDADPSLTLTLFQFIAAHGILLATDVEQCVERNASRFASWVGTHQPVWPAFQAILRSPHAAAALRAMHSTGVLEALFPELLEIDALVIRDFYHRYTVDEHTLVAITAAAELSEKENDAFADVARETEDLDLLMAALLFHDVGKAHGAEGHMESSASVAELALKRCGIGVREWETVRFLIRSHLLLSATMNGRDISDPETSRELAVAVGTVERLKLLTLMTYADISAVHPGALTPWRRQLLWNLYTETDAALTRELRLRVDHPGLALDPAWAGFLMGLPPRYLRTHGRDEIAEHVAMEPEAREHGVSVRLKCGDVCILTVVAQDHPFLFASIAGTLSSFGFNILKAEAFSNAHGLVVDTFSFADPARTLELNPEETEAVTRCVAKAVRGDLSVEQLLKRRPATRPDHYAMRDARASFDNTASPSATLIQLATQDRPGLLFDVASVISRHAGNIEVVLVDTEARKAIDVFYVARANRKLSDAEAVRLTEAIKDVIGVR